jgi:hypothetical protein
MMVIGYMRAKSIEDAKEYVRDDLFASAHQITWPEFRKRQREAKKQYEMFDLNDIK